MMKLLTKSAPRAQMVRQADAEALLAHHRRSELTLTIEGTVLTGHRRTDKGVECVFDTDTMVNLTARTRRGVELCRFDKVNPARLDGRYFTFTIGESALTPGVCDRLGSWIVTPVTLTHTLGHGPDGETRVSVLTDHAVQLDIVGL